MDKGIYSSDGFSSSNPIRKYQKAAASLDKFLEQATDDQKFDLAKKNG